MDTRCAFVFPGQGSQFVGMLGDFATAFPIIHETFTQASDVLNYDLWRLIQEDSENKLNETAYTQPALLVVSIAIWRLWEAQDAPMPVVMAGHSLGEYSALVCAKSLDFQAAVKLVELRGKLMQEAVPAGVGGMAAIIGLSDDRVEELCVEASIEEKEVTPANFNSIGQVVIAGKIDAVLRAINLAKASGARLAKQLPVSVPSHCRLMKSAADKFEEALQAIPFNPPQIPVIHNVNLGCYNDATQIKQALAQQLYCPVRWVETIKQIVEQNIYSIIECGPGKVLTGLNKKIDSDIVSITLNSVESFNEALTLV
jgi:[acyl-carrier-protein] S-malonyltransferase